MPLSHPNAQANAAAADNYQTDFQDQPETAQCTIVGVNNLTGAPFIRGFANLDMLKQWLTQPDAINITVSYIRNS